MKQILVAKLLVLVVLAKSCSKPEDIGTPSGSVIDENGVTVQVFSSWTEVLPINGSGDDKIILRHTEALRTMARTGAISYLEDELSKHDTERVNILKTGHQSDFNRIGFAPQLRVENYIIAMYHPNHYPDHFIVYNIDTKEWTRWEEGKTTNDGMPAVYLTGTGD